MSDDDRGFTRHRGNDCFERVKRKKNEFAICAPVVLYIFFFFLESSDYDLTKNFFLELRGCTKNVRAPTTGPKDDYSMSEPSAGSVFFFPSFKEQLSRFIRIRLNALLKYYCRACFFIFFHFVITFRAIIVDEHAERYNFSLPVFITNVLYCS